MMPDLFHWLLTGVKCNEMSEASTSQFYDPVRGGWATELLERFGLPTGILGRIEQPGTNLGPLRAERQLPRRACRPDVVLPGTHDTASAVMAVPAQSRPGRAARLVLHQPGHVGPDGRRNRPRRVVNDQVLQLNFTNEGGVGNTIRLLKNICGLWLVQECRRSLEPGGQEVELGRPEPAGGGRPAAGLVHQSRRGRVPRPGQHARGHSPLLPADGPGGARATKGRCSAVAWRASP